MNKEEIIIKAVEKAMKNGWDETAFYTMNYGRAKEAGLVKTISEMPSIMPYESLIFSRPFAIGIWGEEIEFCDACNRSHHGNRSDCDMGCGDNQEAWKFHLQQMVLEDEPLKYLAKYL